MWRKDQQVFELALSNGLSLTTTEDSVGPVDCQHFSRSFFQDSAPLPATDHELSFARTFTSRRETDADDAHPGPELGRGSPRPRAAGPTPSPILENRGRSPESLGRGAPGGARAAVLGAALSDGVGLHPSGRATSSLARAGKSPALCPCSLRVVKNWSGRTRRRGAPRSRHPETETSENQRFRVTRPSPGQTPSASTSLREGSSRR